MVRKNQVKGERKRISYSLDSPMIYNYDLLKIIDDNDSNTERKKTKKKQNKTRRRRRIINKA